MDSELQIFDGHNDVVSKLLADERAHARALITEGIGTGSRDFFERGSQGHIDLPRAREGGIDPLLLKRKPVPDGEVAYLEALRRLCDRACQGLPSSR